MPTAAPPQARRGSAQLKRFNTFLHRLHVKSSACYLYMFKVTLTACFSPKKWSNEKKQRGVAKLESGHCFTSLESQWCNTQSVYGERERARDMFDDDNQSVARMMKLRRKQDTVPSPAEVRPATIRRESDDDRFNPELNCQPAFISCLRSPVTKTGLSVLPGLGSLLFRQCCIKLFLLCFSFWFGSKIQEWTTNGIWSR